MKKIVICLICCLLCFSLVLQITACDNNSANNSQVSANSDTGITSNTTTNSNSSTTTSNGSSNATSNSTLTSSSGSDSSHQGNVSPNEIPNEQPNLNNDMSTLAPELFLLSKSGATDGSYTGTDQIRGFSTVLTRTTNTFETVPEGYGAQTTGGRGATAENIYTVTTGLEFENALTSITAKQTATPEIKSIIYVNGEITEANTDEGDATNVDYQIIVNSINNLSVIGNGTTGIFNGVGLNYKSCNNVIVQNLTIHHPSRVLHNEKDCLEFNNCKFVWADHCEFYNDSPINSGEKDYFDGLLDVKNESENVTISYNSFHDSWKTSLVGSGPDDTYYGRTITYHHNIFNNCNSRMPAIRSGFGHIYNNYYNGIKSSGINCRINAEVYIENNIFENTKKPICAEEDSIIGSYNLKGNTFTSCTNVPTTSTCDFTPSYAYTLDETTNLKAYLEATVGVGKINVETAKELSSNYTTYTIPVEKIIIRSIEELETATYTDEYYQKILYLAKKVAFCSTDTFQKITNIAKLNSEIAKYNELYATELDTRINTINTSGAFDVNATETYNLKNAVNLAGQFVTEHMTKVDVLNAAVTYYDTNFVSLFNAQADTFATTVLSSQIDTINNLLSLYSTIDASITNGANITAINTAKTKCDNLIATESFVTLLNAMPSASTLTANDSGKVATLKTAYAALTEGQLNLLTTSQKTLYNDLISAFNVIAGQSRSMDLSSIATGRKTVVTSIGQDIYIGVSTDINNVTASFNSNNYTKAVYLSGYGNAGSKCVQFKTFSTSNITLVLNTKDTAGKLLLTDPSKNVIDSVTTSDGQITTITFSNVEVGDYRIFTDVPSTSGQSSSAFIYSLVITPTN